MNFEPGVTPFTASFSPLQQDLAFEFGVDIINHLQSPSTKFELIALRYSGSREIDNGVTPATELPRLPYIPSSSKIMHVVKFRPMSIRSMLTASTISKNTMKN